MVRTFSGFFISARYFLTNAAHCAGVRAFRPSFIVSTRGARLGNHTSYQLRDANSGLRHAPRRPPDGSDSEAFVVCPGAAQPYYADSHYSLL